MPHPRPTVDEATRAYVYGYPLVYDRGVGLRAQQPARQRALQPVRHGARSARPRDEVRHAEQRHPDRAAHTTRWRRHRLAVGCSPVRLQPRRAGAGHDRQPSVEDRRPHHCLCHSGAGGHAYELRLPSAPPVGAFWSLSMYDVPNYYLVPNAIDRYSIGSATPELGVADDGSITITMQADEPSPDRRANWLPAPTGAFRPVLRMYMPDDAILEGRYQVPPITRIEPST